MQLSKLIGVLCLSLLGCADPTADFKTKGDETKNDVCLFGTGRCNGQQTYRCAEDGSKWIAGEECQWPTTCEFGFCQDPCSISKATRSYVGCEYFAVDLDNAPSATGYSPENAQFAIVVSYAGKTENPTKVKIFSRITNEEKLVAEGMIYPGDIHVFEVGPQNVKATTRGLYAFRVVSSAPVTAYQFNPLNNTQEAYSNDASLLLPVSSLDNEYIAVTGESMIVQDTNDSTKQWEMGAFVTVVGVEDNTEVKIYPTAPIRAGSGFPAGKAPITYRLQRYEVISISSQAPSGEEGGNLSGTVVKANKKVAVFSGNGATTVPSGEQAKCCADHLEEQLFPLSAWGKTFIAPRSLPRKLVGSPEADWWRLTGGKDGLQLTYQPQTPVGAPTELKKGESVIFSTTESFIVSANGPILLTQFLASAMQTGDFDNSTCKSDADCMNSQFIAACHRGYCGPVGDPAMILIPPVEQFRDEYVFLAPNDYYQDYASFIVPLDEKVELDRQEITQTVTPIGEYNGKPYGLAHVLLSDGKHHAQAKTPFGVIAYGLDAFVSYGYPAGLDLKRINLE